MYNKVLELEKILTFLKKRNLIPQYKKAKGYILSGKLKNVDFKKREPKELGIIYFRINKQYRAFGRISGDQIIIFKIDNHQN